MLKSIALVVVLLIAGLLVYAATRPDAFRVERTVLIKAPPERIYPLVNDFNQWGAWSPYEKKDPAMKRSFGSTTVGKGAVYEWNGNSQVGQGRMEILETTPSSKVGIKLDFIKPIEGHNIAEFSFVPQADATQVAWVIHGPAPFMTKLMGVFFDMDKMIGQDFEVGLANLKSLAEK